MRDPFFLGFAESCSYTLSNVLSCGCIEIFLGFGVLGSIFCSFTRNILKMMEASILVKLMRKGLFDVV